MAPKAGREQEALTPHEITGIRGMAEIRWSLSCSLFSCVTSNNSNVMHYPSASSFNDFLYFVFPAGEENSSVSQLTSVKHRILHFLGSLGGSMNHTLEDKSCDRADIVAWDTHQHLRFEVPFYDMKPVIYFGEWHFYLMTKKYIP